MSGLLVLDDGEGGVIMGLDLIIYVDKYQVINNTPDNQIRTLYLNMGIYLDRDYALFEMLGLNINDRKNQIIFPKEINNNIKIYQSFDDGIRLDNTDAYGETLKFCIARDFVNIDEKISSQFNEAVLLFFQKLPPETPLILFWN